MIDALHISSAFLSVSFFFLFHNWHRTLVFICPFGVSNKKLPRFVRPASYRSCKFENNEPILRRAENDGLIDRSINRSNQTGWPPWTTMQLLSLRYRCDIPFLTDRTADDAVEKMMKPPAWCTVGEFLKIDLTTGWRNYPIPTDSFGIFIEFSFMSVDQSHVVLFVTTVHPL